MRQSLPLALALLLVFAGCSSPLGGPQTESVTPFTVTPVESTTSMRPVTGGDDTGRFDAWLDAHWAVLNNTTYTYEMRTSFRQSGSTATNRSRSVVLAPNHSRYLVHSTDDRGRSGAWSNGTHLVEFWRDSTDSDYEVRRTERVYRRDVRRLLSQSMSYITVETIRETASGYRVVGGLTPQARERLIESTVDVENVSVWLRIRDDGLIRTFHLGWTGTADGDHRWGRAHITFDPSVEAVPRPDWVDGVIGNTSVETPREPA